MPSFRNRFLAFLRSILFLTIAGFLCVLSVYYYRVPEVPQPVIIRTIHGQLKEPIRFKYNSSGEFKYPYADLRLTGRDSIYLVERCVYRYLHEDLGRRLNAGDSVTIDYYASGQDYLGVVRISSREKGVVLNASYHGNCDPERSGTKLQMVVAGFFALLLAVEGIRSLVNNGKEADEQED